MPNVNANLAFLAQVEEDYGTLKISARVGYFDPDGYFVSPTFSWGTQPAEQFDGFIVGAYLGNCSGLSESESTAGVWGVGHCVKVHSIESVRHAKTITSILTKVETGLAKIENSDGYVNRDDYATYLLRIAKVLHIPTIHVRNFRGAFEMTGDRYRLNVTAPTLQSWVQTAVDFRKNDRSKLLVRG